MGDDFTHAHYVPATALALLAADPLFTNRFGAAYMQDFAKRHTGTEMFNDITGEFSIWDNSAYASREDFREYGIFTSKREESRAQELGFNVYGHYANRDLGFLQAKTMPAVPKAMSGYRGYIYLMRDHSCLFAQDPGIQLQESLRSVELQRPGGRTVFARKFFE